MREVYWPLSVLYSTQNQLPTYPQKTANTHDEPLQHGDRAVLRRLPVCDRGEQLRPLAPVGCPPPRQDTCLARGGERGRMRGVPGNSVSETGERMNGGAVMDDRSPENEAILGAPEASSSARCDYRVQGARGTHDLTKDVQLPRCAAGTACGWQNVQRARRSGISGAHSPRRLSHLWGFRS